MVLIGGSSHIIKPGAWPRLQLRSLAEVVQVDPPLFMRRQAKALLAGGQEIVGEDGELADQRCHIAGIARPLGANGRSVSGHGYHGERAQLAFAGEPQMLLQQVDHRGRVLIDRRCADGMELSHRSTLICLFITHATPRNNSQALTAFLNEDSH